MSLSVHAASCKVCMWQPLTQPFLVPILHISVRIICYVPVCRFPFYTCLFVPCDTVWGPRVSQSVQISESIGPFVHVFVWAFILANVLPFELLWMLYRLVSLLVTSLFAVRVQWGWFLLLSGNSNLLRLILCFVDRASWYNCVKKNRSCRTTYS
jgi:hypothetical protein